MRILHTTYFRCGDWGGDSQKEPKALTVPEATQVLTELECQKTETQIVRYLRSNARLGAQPGDDDPVIDFFEVLRAAAVFKDNDGDGDGDGGATGKNSVLSPTKDVETKKRAIMEALN